MTEMYMKRSYHFEVVTIPNGEAISNAFSMQGYAILMVTSFDALTGTPEIGFNVSNMEDGTFRSLDDETGALVELTNVTQNTPMSTPSDVAGVGWCKLRTQNSGTDEDQTGAKTFLVELKS